MAGMNKAGLENAAALTNGKVIDLWPGGIAPGSEASTRVFTLTERSSAPFRPDRVATGITRPSLTAFVPDQPNGTVVIAAPGGAYSRIVVDKEAAEIARWLNPLGVTVLVLLYRLPGEGHAQASDAPLADAQRAVRVVRQHAAEWGLLPDQIGFLGASAGGHVAAMLGGQFGRPAYHPVDSYDQLSARPDFMVLLYPVISMEDELCNAESRVNLISENPSGEAVRAYSAEHHVNINSPETFIVLAEDDRTVSPKNGLSYRNALVKHGVRTMLCSYPEGGHGFGTGEGRQLPLSEWPALAAEWLSSGGHLPGVPRPPFRPGIIFE